MEALLSQLEPFAPDAESFGRIHTDFLDLAEACRWFLSKIDENKDKSLSVSELEDFIIGVDIHFVQHASYHLKYLGIELNRMLEQFPNDGVESSTPTIASFSSELKRARAERGIKHGDAADLLGMSWPEYFDLEAYDDEWFMVTPAYIVRRAITFLKVEWKTCRDWKKGLILPSDKDLSTFIVERREHFKLSREEMAERAGFDVKFAEVIEGHSDGLALWPLAAAMHLAEALGLDEEALARRLVVGR